MISNKHTYISTLAAKIGLPTLIFCTSAQGHKLHYKLNSAESDSSSKSLPDPDIKTDIFECAWV